VEKAPLFFDFHLQDHGKLNGVEMKALVPALTRGQMYGEKEITSGQGSFSPARPARKIFHVTHHGSVGVWEGG
jgi:hypothetical protein